MPRPEALVQAGLELDGRYVLEERLGAGGMGEVWRGTDRLLARPVAVKLMRERLADDALVARFQREARLAARLRHPGITLVYDIGSHDGRPFMVMELLDGHDLAETLRVSPAGLSVDVAVSLAIQAAEALRAAHARQIIHRDLKPANLFLQRGGGLKICDFGIAQAADLTTSLTAAGEPIGTPYYMSPEQCEGRPVNARSDLYSLGCVLHELLTGRPPFPDGPPLAIMFQHMSTAPMSLRAGRPDIPAELDHLVLELLAKDPESRPADAGAIAATLTSLRARRLSVAERTAAMLAELTETRAPVTHAQDRARTSADQQPGVIGRGETPGSSAASTEAADLGRASQAPTARVGEVPTAETGPQASDRAPGEVSLPTQDPAVRLVGDTGPDDPQASVRRVRPGRWRPAAVLLSTAALVVAGLYIVTRLSTVSCPSTARRLTDVGNGPRALAVTPDGRTLYVADSAAGTVTPVSTCTNAAGAPIPVGKDPVALVVSNSGKMLYVADWGDGTVTPVTVATGTPGKRINTGGHPNALALTPDGKTLYVATGTAVRAIATRPTARTAGAPIPIGRGPLALAMSRDGQTVYAASADRTVTPIATFNGHLGTPIPVGARPSALAVSNDGRWLYVADSGDGTVTPVSTATGAPGAPIPVGGDPAALAVAPDGQTLYVAGASGAVTPVSTATGLPGAAIRVSGATDAMAIAPSAKVLYAASGSNVVTVRPLPPSPSQPTGFEVMSMTFIGKWQGWALGTVGCDSGRCLQLLHKTKGRRWTPIKTPVTYPASFGVCPTGQPCAGQIAFVGSDGYAFDPSPMVSTNGGDSWNTDGATYVTSLAASANGLVVEVTSPAAGCTGGPYPVQRAGAGSRTWTTLSPQPPISGVCPPILYSQNSRIALVGYGNPARRASAAAQIRISEDNGGGWVQVPDKCRSNDGYASAVALALPRVLALLCQRQAPSTAGRSGQAWIRISVNDGTQFRPSQQVGHRGPAIGAIVHYQLAAASSNVLIIAETGTKGSKLLFTGDAGRTWHCPLVLRGSEPVDLVGYENQSIGRVAQGNAVWTTTDGGKRWTKAYFSAG